jgi:aspartate/methionine/tyrosine aminotransferase
VQSGQRSPHREQCRPPCSPRPDPQVPPHPGRTDEDFVLGLLRAKGILCVHGSGFGLPADGGYFRVVFLAPPEELSVIYDEVEDFAREFSRA